MLQSQPSLLFRLVEVGNAVCMVFFNTLLRRQRNTDLDADPTDPNIYKAKLSLAQRL